MSESYTAIVVLVRGSLGYSGWLVGAGAGEMIPTEVLWCSNQRHRAGNGWSFPPNVEKLLRRLTEGKSVLQLFGGQAQWGVTLDIDAQLRPRVIGDAWMPPFRRDAFDVVIVDPPYRGINQQMKTALMHGAAFVARESVIWFHTMWIGNGAPLTCERAWLVRVGDSCACRCVQQFKVAVDKPTPSHVFTRGPAIRYNRWLAGQLGLPYDRTAPRIRP